ncbi:MAG: hypothetical protein QG653_497 [Patescibacteria group bacterium]|nr:hypothetical protein [Patescibacteria group bacterium]
MSIEILVEGVGWVGTFLVILAYFLVSTKKVHPESAYYQILNLLGALGVGANVFYQQVWPAFALQVVWGCIAIISLVRHRTQ